MKQLFPFVVCAPLEKFQMHLLVQERKKISGLNVHERQKLWLILQFAVII